MRLLFPSSRDINKLKRFKCRYFNLNSNVSYIEGLLHFYHIVRGESWKYYGYKKNLPFTIHFHISFKWLPLGIACQQISSNSLYFPQHPRKIVIPQCCLENLNITSDFRIFQFHFTISSESVIMGTTFN